MSAAVEDAPGSGGLQLLVHGGSVVYIIVLFIMDRWWAKPLQPISTCQTLLKGGVKLRDAEDTPIPLAADFQCRCGVPKLLLRGIVFRHISGLLMVNVRKNVDS